MIYVEPLSAGQLSGFVHKRVFKGAGVGVQGGCFETQLPSGFAPGRNNREEFVENFLRLRRREAKARRSGQRPGDGRLFLIFRDGSVELDELNYA